MDDGTPRATETERQAAARRSVLAADAERSSVGTPGSALRWAIPVVAILVIAAVGYVLVGRLSTHLATPAEREHSHEAPRPSLERVPSASPQLPPFETQRLFEPGTGPSASARAPVAADPSTGGNRTGDTSPVDFFRQSEPEVPVPFDAERVVAALATADIAKGADQFRICQVCHTAGPGASHRVGPNLWNVVGSRKAAAPGYSYSRALIEKGGTWSFEELARYLNDPRVFVPGGKMAFAGLKSEGRLADLLAHVRTLADQPKPMPPAHRR